MSRLLRSGAVLSQPEEKFDESADPDVRYHQDSLTPHGTGFPFPPPPGISAEMLALMKFMKDKRHAEEDQRSAEEEEKRIRGAERRQADAERDYHRRAEDSTRFEARIARLTVAQVADHAALLSTPGPGLSAPPSSCPSTPAPPKAAAQPPPILKSDVTFQYFRECQQRWNDYATMVDLQSLTLPKQLTQLRICLSLETQSALEHMLQIPPTSSSFVEEVLHVL